jgi:hypothetical protein
MPIDFDLEALRKTHACVNYFETGLYDSRCDVSAKLALTCNFEKLFSIEIDEQWIAIGNDVFKEEIASQRLTLLKDDSSNMKKYLTSDVFKNKTLFFLDAHINTFEFNNKRNCPLFDELDAIQSLERKDNIICIDDVRILKTNIPWNERSYGNINYIEKIKEKILSINENYTFSFLNGHIENDVLLASI